MNDRIGLLATLLAVQVLLVLAVYLTGGAQVQGRTFLDLDPDRISAIEIRDAEGKEVRLVRVGETWQVGDLPADGDKIRDLLESLLSEEPLWPVATSEESARRFEVTEDAYQRRISFYAESSGDDALAVVYIGTSPGFRRVHARREGDDAVFSIDFAAYEAPADADDWLDKTLLHAESVKSVVFPNGQVLEKSESGGWMLDGAVADAKAVDELVRRLERLTVIGLKEVADDGALGEPRTLVITDSAGEHTLTLRFDEEADEYLLTSSRYPGAFALSSYIAEQILVDPETLLADAGASSESAAGPGAAAGGAETRDSQAPGGTGDPAP